MHISCGEQNCQLLTTKQQEEGLGVLSFRSLSYPCLLLRYFSFLPLFLFLIPFPFSSLHINYTFLSLSFIPPPFHPSFSFSFLPCVFFFFFSVSFHPFSFLSLSFLLPYSWFHLSFLSSFLSFMSLFWQSIFFLHLLSFLP